MLINLTQCKNPVIVDPSMRPLLMMAYNKNPKTSRKRADINRLRGSGGRTYSYAVGCSRCQICQDELVEKKRNKWFIRLSGMIREFRENGFERWRKGEVEHFAKGEVFFVTLTVANESYPGASWLNRLSNNEVYQLNRDLRFRSRSLREVRQWFHRLMHDTSFKHSQFPYVVFPEFGTKSTRRIHLHCFFFMPGDMGLAHSRLRDLLLAWQKLTGTDQGDVRLIEDDIMASAYITKYVLKTGALRNRTMSTQFGWYNYEKLFRLKSHALPVTKHRHVSGAGYYRENYKGGDTRWHVMIETIHCMQPRRITSKPRSRWSIT